MRLLCRNSADEVEEMEEGEISDSPAASSTASTPGYLYDAALEWPGESASPSGPTFEDAPDLKPRKSTSSQPSFRLVILRSSILSPKHKLAIIDSYAELQFGRDIAPSGTDIPRIRLKEMEVSKLHATAYWDGARKEWGIVDMGSKHGTYVRSAGASSEETGVRLSPPRVASVPRRLHHLDCITIGSTSLLVHIHLNQLPCEQCSPTGSSDEIALFPASKGSVSSKRSRDIAGLDSLDDPLAQASTYIPKAPHDPKKALNLLKRSLLARIMQPEAPGSPHPRSTSLGETPGPYMDRSARRRALHRASHIDSPGVTPSPSLSWEPPHAGTPIPPPTPVVSQPPTPLPATNMGHRLLMKQGWAPGTSLSASEDPEERGLVEPIDVNPRANRAGLGSKPPILTPALGGGSYQAEVNANANANWKEEAKFRRWNAFAS